MKTSSTWNFRSIVGKIMMGLVLAAMIGSIDVAPALGKDDHKRMGKHDNGRYEHRGRGYDRDRYVQGRRVVSALWLQGTSLCPAAGHLCTASTAGHQYLFPTHLYSSLRGLLRVGCPAFKLS